MPAVDASHRKAFVHTPDHCSHQSTVGPTYRTRRDQPSHRSADDAAKQTAEQTAVESANETANENSFVVAIESPDTKAHLCPYLCADVRADDDAHQKALR